MKATVKLQSKVCRQEKDEKEEEKGIHQSRSLTITTTTTTTSSFSSPASKVSSLPPPPPPTSASTSVDGITATSLHLAETAATAASAKVSRPLRCSMLDSHLIIKRRRRRRPLGNFFCRSRQWPRFLSCIVRSPMIEEKATLPCNQPLSMLPLLDFSGRCSGIHFAAAPSPPPNGLEKTGKGHDGGSGAGRGKFITTSAAAACLKRKRKRRRSVSPLLFGGGSFDDVARQQQQQQQGRLCKEEEKRTVMRPKKCKSGNATALDPPPPPPPPLLLPLCSTGGHLDKSSDSDDDEEEKKKEYYNSKNDTTDDLDSVFTTALLLPSPSSSSCPLEYVDGQIDNNRRGGHNSRNSTKTLVECRCRCHHYHHHHHQQQRPNRDEKLLLLYSFPTPPSALCWDGGGGRGPHRRCNRSNLCPNLLSAEKPFSSFSSFSSSLIETASVAATAAAAAKTNINDDEGNQHQQQHQHQLISSSSSPSSNLSSQLSSSPLPCLPSPMPPPSPPPLPPPSFWSLCPTSSSSFSSSSSPSSFLSPISEAFSASTLSPSLLLPDRSSSKSPHCRRRHSRTTSYSSSLPPLFCFPLFSNSICQSSSSSSVISRFTLFVLHCLLSLLLSSSASFHPLNSSGFASAVSLQSASPNAGASFFKMNNSVRVFADFSTRASETSDAAAFSVNKLKKEKKKKKKEEDVVDDERQQRSDATAKEGKFGKNHFYDVFCLLPLARGRNNDDDDDGDDRHSFVPQQHHIDSSSPPRPSKSSDDSLFPRSQNSSSSFFFSAILVIYVNDELPAASADVPSTASNRCGQLQLQLRQCRQTNDAAAAAAPQFCGSFIPLQPSSPTTRTSKKKNGCTLLNCTGCTAVRNASSTEEECRRFWLWRKGQTLVQLTDEEKKGQIEGAKLQRLQNLLCHCRLFGCLVESEKLRWRWLKTSYTSASRISCRLCWNNGNDDDDDQDNEDQRVKEDEEKEEDENNKGSTKTTELCLCGRAAAADAGADESSGKQWKAENEKEEKGSRRRRSTETNADSDLSSSTNAWSSLPSTSSSSSVPSLASLGTRKVPTSSSSKRAATKTTNYYYYYYDRQKGPTAASTDAATADDARRSSPPSSDAGHNSSIRSRLSAAEAGTGNGNGSGNGSAGCCWPQSLNPKAEHRSSQKIASDSGGRIRATSASASASASAAAAAASSLTGGQLKRIHDHDDNDDGKKGANDAENLLANSKQLKLLQPTTTAAATTSYPVVDRRMRTTDRNTKAAAAVAFDKTQSFEANQRKEVWKLNQKKNKGNTNDGDWQGFEMAATESGRNDEESERENGSLSAVATDLTAASQDHQHLKATEAASAALEQFQPGNWRSSGKSKQKWPLRRRRRKRRPTEPTESAKEKANNSNSSSSSKLPIEAIEIDGSKDNSINISSRRRRRQPSLPKMRNKSMNSSNSSRNSKDDNKYTTSSNSAFPNLNSSWFVNELPPEQERQGQKTPKIATLVPLSQKEESVEQRGRRRSGSIRVKRSSPFPPAVVETLNRQRGETGAVSVNQERASLSFSITTTKKQPDTSKKAGKEKEAGEGLPSSISSAKEGTTTADYRVVRVEATTLAPISTTTTSSSAVDQRGSHFFHLLNSAASLSQPTTSSSSFHQQQQQHYSTNLVASGNRLPGDISTRRRTRKTDSAISSSSSSDRLETPKRTEAKSAFISANRSEKEEAKAWNIVSSAGTTTTTTTKTSLRPSQALPPPPKAFALAFGDGGSQKSDDNGSVNKLLLLPQNRSSLSLGNLKTAKTVTQTEGKAESDATAAKLAAAAARAAGASSSSSPSGNVGASVGGNDDQQNDFNAAAKSNRSQASRLKVEVAGAVREAKGGNLHVKPQQQSNAATTAAAAAPPPDMPRIINDHLNAADAETAVVAATTTMSTKSNSTTTTSTITNRNNVAKAATAPAAVAGENQNQNRSSSGTGENGNRLRMRMTAAATAAANSTAELNGKERNNDGRDDVLRQQPQQPPSHQGKTINSSSQPPRYQPQNYRLQTADEQKSDNVGAEKIARASSSSSSSLPSLEYPASTTPLSSLVFSAISPEDYSHPANDRSWPIQQQQQQQQQGPNYTTAAKPATQPKSSPVSSSSSSSSSAPQNTTTTTTTSAKTGNPDATSTTIEPESPMIVGGGNRRQSPTDAAVVIGGGDQQNSNDTSTTVGTTTTTTSSASSSSSFYYSSSSVEEESSPPPAAEGADDDHHHHYCPAGPDPSSVVSFGRHHPPPQQVRLTWARTDAGVLALLPCQPAGRFTGTVYRPCFSGGAWGPTDLGDCRLVALAELHRLVVQHVQRRLFEGLVPLTGQLAHLLFGGTSKELLLPPPPLSSPLDRLDGLAALQHIFAHSGKVKAMRIEADAEEERRTIAFVQSLVLISEHLLIDTKSVQFPVDAQEQTNQLQEAVVLTMNALCNSMANLLRALILSLQDGSLKTLLLQPTPLLPTSLKHFEITLSHRASGSASLKPLVSSKAAPPQLSPLSLSSSSSSKSAPSSEKPKLTINLQNFTHIGVGVVEIWLRHLGTSLDQGGWRLVSDLLAVSILPAVSIEVDFEVAPRFEVLLPLHSSHDALLFLEKQHFDQQSETEVETVTSSTAKTATATSTILTKEDDDTASTTPTTLNSEQSELKEDFGWSSNVQAAAAAAANDPSSSLSSSRQLKSTRQKKVKIGCGRLLTQLTSSPSPSPPPFSSSSSSSSSSEQKEQQHKRSSSSIWTTEGCQTATLSVHYLKCICSLPGVIGALTVPVQEPPETVDSADLPEDEDGEIVPSNPMMTDDNNNNNMEQVMGSRDPATTVLGSSNPPDQLASSGMSSSYRASSVSGMSTADSTSTSTTNVFFNNNAHVQRHLLYGGRLRSPRHLSAYDLSLYGSLALSILLLVTSLVVQFRFRKYETRETFFIVRNLLLSLLLIQLTFLLGTTFHMDLFWVKVARWTSSSSSSASPSQSSSFSSVAEVTSSTSPSSSSSNTFLTFARLQHSLCLSVPVFLHFIHLAVLFWMLSHTILLYQRFWRPQVSGTLTGAGEDDNHDRHLLHSCCKAGGGGSGINGCRRSMKTGSGGKLSKGKKCNVEVNNSNSSQLSLTSKECRRRYLKKLRANRHFCGSASSSSSSPSSSLSSSSSFFSSFKGNPLRFFLRLLKSSFTFVCYAPLQVLALKMVSGKHGHGANGNNNNNCCSCASSSSCEGGNSKLHQKHLNLQKQNLRQQQQQQCELPMENIHQRSSSSDSAEHSQQPQQQNLKSNQPFRVRDEGHEEESSAYHHHHLCERHRLEEKMSVSLPNQNQGSDLLGNRCSSATVTLKVAEDAAGQLKNSKSCSYCCGCCFSTSSSPPTTSALFFCTWKCIHFIAFSMGLPFLLVLFSYLLNSKGYETRRYCWMSIEGGIQYSFIIPVLGLISTNTLLMLLVLKRYFERKPLLVKAAKANNNSNSNSSSDNNSDGQQQHHPDHHHHHHQQQQQQQQQHHHQQTTRYHLNSIRPSLRASIILLPFFSFNWFLSVLSLETMSTSPFELIFALSNCLHAFLVFYYHCYQRYNIHVFLGHRCRRLHLKRRLAKLLYRLLSALNLNNRWRWWWRRWCDQRRAGAAISKTGGRKNNSGSTGNGSSSSSSSRAISRSSSFNWSSDFAGGGHDQLSDDHHYHHQHHHFHNQQQQQQQQQYSSSFVSGNTSDSAVRGYPSKAYSDDQVFQHQQHQQQQQQHYQSGQPVQPPVPPTASTTEYKCNSSGLYCNHCYYCDSCGSQQVVTFDPRTTTATTSSKEGDHHHPLHTTYYCTCSTAVQPLSSSSSSPTLSNVNDGDQNRQKMVQQNEQFQQHHDHHHYHSYHQQQHQQLQQQQQQYLQFGNEDEDEEVVIVELDDDDDDDDEIIVGSDEEEEEEDGSEVGSSDEVVDDDDDDDDADIEELAELANSLQLNELYLASRKDY